MKYNKSKIMKKAWNIAWKLSNKHGGNEVEYLSIALKQAWEVAKAEQRIKEDRLGYDKEEGTITPANAVTGGRRSWIAEITGMHPQYKFNRSFINEETVELEEGKIYSWTGYEGNVFGRLVNNNLELLESEDVEVLVA